MPSIELVNRISTNPSSSQTTLPGLLQTPAGLAIIEIQGTIHLPSSDESNGIEVGRLDFPLYDKAVHGDKEGAWMKKARLYIGKHQVLSGEVKKLGKPLAVIAKDPDGSSTDPDEQRFENGRPKSDRLSIVSIISYKVIFSSRPEPVGQLQSVSEMTPTT